MRLSTMPFTGTVSAPVFVKHSRAQTASILLFMVRLLCSRLFDQHFGFGSKIDDLEFEWIPSTRLRVFRRFHVGVLDCRDPVAVRLLAAGARARGFQIPHLCEIGQPAGTGKETH